jgi:hypothetical protein
MRDAKSDTEGGNRLSSCLISRYRRAKACRKRDGIVNNSLGQVDVSQTV